MFGSSQPLTANFSLSSPFISSFFLRPSGLATTTMTAGHSVPKPIALALFIIRILSPALVLLATSSLIFSRPSVPTSPSPITSVVVANRIPRRAAILALLSIASLTFLFDGLSFVFYAVWDKYWQQNTGIEINAILGILAFSGLAALGSWKELHGVKVWDLKRLKTSMFFALVLDIAIVALTGVYTEFKKGCACMHFLDDRFHTKFMNNQ